MEATDQGVKADSHVEGNPVVEVREELTTYDNPLVKKLPMADNTFHFPMEGHLGSSNWVVNHPSDDTEGTKYGPSAPFWKTSLGQSIYEFGTTRPSFVNPSRDAPWNEEMFRRVHPTIDCLIDFQERIANITTSPLPHQEPMSALLPCLP